MSFLHTNKNEYILVVLQVKFPMAWDWLGTRFTGEFFKQFGGLIDGL